MKFLRPLVALVFILFLASVAVIWWTTPAKADMADYVPADGLVYVEVNSLVNLTNALRQSEVLTPFLPLIAIDSHPSQGWSLSAARAGLGPTTAVILSRAQMALVVTNIETIAEGDSLKVKPQAAIVIETHTSQFRMKSTALAAVQQLAQFAYGEGTCTETDDQIECPDPKSSRKIIAVIEGTVVIIGNSKEAVQACVDVRHNKRPSLHTDQELAQSRAALRAASALSFGYVSQSNSARLVSVVTPLLLGRATENKLDQLLSRSAGQILRGVSWTSNTTAVGIEDRYQIGLEPEVIKRLEPVFDTATVPEDFWKLVPDAFRSITVYRSKDPEVAWSSLNSAISVKVDAVTSVVASGLLRAGLAAYNIDDPKLVLQNLSTPLLTLRPILGEDSLLLARVKDEQALRSLLTATFEKNGGQIATGRTAELKKDREFTGLFVDGFVILGKTESVRIYLTQLQNNETVTPRHLEIMDLKNRENSAAIVTYSNETSTVGAVIDSLARFSRQPLTEDQLAAIMEKLDNRLTSTESTLNSNGIERRTRSSFGQFGNLISLAANDSTHRLR